MSAVVTLIPGDGIGPQIVEGAARVFESAGAEVDWDRQFAGLAALEKGLGLLPDETVQSIRRNGVALKGRSRHRSARVFARSTSRFASCSTSTRTCGRQRRSSQEGDTRMST